MMEVIVEFKLPDGKKISARVLAQNVDHGKRIIQKDHPDAEILSYYRANNDENFRFPPKRKW